MTDIIPETSLGVHDKELAIGTDARSVSMVSAVTETRGERVVVRESVIVGVNEGSESRTDALEVEIVRLRVMTGVESAVE